MAFAYVPGAPYVKVAVKRPRPGPRGVIKAGKAFNHFPAIIAAFPDACSAIVIETTEELGAVAQALAPTQQDPRRGDPAPGTLKASKKTSYFRRKGSDLVVTGKVSFPATDPRGHRYAKPLETGSVRRTRHGLIRVRKGSGWLVDSIVAERRAFLGRLGDLESRLPG
jgi:hypothetical protein